MAAYEDDDLLFAQGYGRKVGERLRVIRRQKKLSLQEVEAQSGQEFKASVLGAYERGERAISVPASIAWPASTGSPSTSCCRSTTRTTRRRRATATGPVVSITSTVAPRSTSPVSSSSATTTPRPWPATCG